MFRRPQIILFCMALLSGAMALGAWWLTPQGTSSSAVQFLPFAFAFVSGMFVLLMLWILLTDLVDFLFWPLGVKGRDDRGRVVMLPELPKMPSPIRIDRAMKKEMARWGRLNFRLYLRAFLVPVLVLTSIILFIWLMDAIGFKLPWYAAVLFGVGGPPLVLSLFKGPLARCYAQFLVSVGRCASCGYDLLHLPRQTDGCVVCPECGAAWRRATNEPGAVV